MKKLVFVVFFTAFAIVGLSQFQIKIKSTKQVDSLLFFRATMFDDKNFIPKDTVNLYKGSQAIKSNKPIIGGIYYFYFPKSKQKIYFFLENKDSLQFEFTDSNYLQTVKTNKKKNQIFIQYQNIERNLSKYDTAFSLEVAKGRKFGAVQKASFFKAKTDTLTIFRNSVLKSYKDNDILKIYFEAMNALDASVPNKKDYLSRENFINKFDFNNPKLFFTPIYKSILVEYYSYFPLQADSLLKGVDTIFSRLLCSSKAYSFVFDYTTKLLKNREISNNTEGYAYFIEKYVKNGNCPILDFKIKEALLNELAQVKSQQLQDTCVNMQLKDTSGVLKDLHVFAKDYNYTLIIFYDPTCEHCKVEVPKMDSVIKLLEQQLLIKIGKYAVCNETNMPRNSWVDFINSYHLKDNYAHVSLNNDMEIRKSYNAFSNPLFYLIDKDGILLAKKISVSTLRKELIKAFQHFK